MRSEDYGYLWEHIVLNDLVGYFQPLKIQYWRSKQGHEIDFIVTKQCNHSPIAIECKWNSRLFDPANLKAFRNIYPEGKNYVVAMILKDHLKKDIAI